MKAFILNCYFVFYNLSYTKPSLKDKEFFWRKALVMLSIPIFTGTLFSAGIIFDAFNWTFKVSFVTMILLFFAIYSFLKNLIFKFYKIDLQEDGSGHTIFITKGTILQAVLLYVIGFGIMLIRTQLKFGSLVKP
jgi:hypothetical protein